MAIRDIAAVSWLGMTILLLAGYMVLSYLVLAFKSRSYGSLKRNALIAWWDVLGISYAWKMKQAQDDDQFNTLMCQVEQMNVQHYGKRGRTTSYIAMGRPGISTKDARNVHALLSTKFHDFGLGTDRIQSFLPMLGAGIFASDGKAWEHSRAMLRPNFAREQVGNLELEERHCRELFNVFPSIDAEGWTGEFDLQPLFFKLTMDSSTEFFFGESSHSLHSSPDSPEARFVAAFDRGQYYTGIRTTMGPFYWLMNSAQYRADNDIVHQWTDQRVLRALQRHQLKGKSGSKERYIFLDELIEQTSDPIELRSQLLNVLIAGRDTTAGLLSWVFYLLARRPHEYGKLRAAVLATFGTSTAPREEITFTALKACKPLQNVMRETLRLYPGVPFNFREALRDTSLPRGGGPDGEHPVFVAKGTQVEYSVYMMHRDQEVWGSNAEDFVPDRWETVRPGWNYLPFNGGPRICLGQQFSLTSAGYCIVRMLQLFDRVDTSDTRPPKLHVALTGSSANGVHVKLHRARDG